jgi:hypothetical protein
MNTMPKPGDKGAAFIGLIASALVIGVVLFGMVKWTDSRFEGHAAGAAPAAGATSGH